MSSRPAAVISTARASMNGATLIELMVSLLIGLLLIAGAITVYVQSRNTYRVNETAARLQEVARYALDIIEPDVRLAGYWGLTNRPDSIDNRGGPADPQVSVAASITRNCGNNWVVDVTRSLDGRDAMSTGGAGYDLDCGATNPVGWSDVLIVRRASTNTRPLTNGRLQIQTNRLQGEIFKNGIRPSYFAEPPFSETRDLIVNAYYISDRGPDARGLRQFQLRRQTLTGGPAINDVEIIPGVEDLQVQFGVDVDPFDGNVDQYVNPGQVPAGARVAAARIWLLIIAEDREVGFLNNLAWAYANADYGSFNDDRRRVLISKTIQIRNSPL